MKKMMISIVGLFLLPILFACFLDGYGQKMPTKKMYDAIVVAGCKVRSDGTPSLALQARTKKAIELYEMGYATKIIFTGGSIDNRPTEARTAKNYALSVSNIPNTNLLVEEQSTSTKSNAQFAKNKFSDIEDIIIVSDSYHIYRAEKIFKQYFATVEGSGRVPKWSVRIKGAFREIPALFYYRWKGYI